MIRGPTSQEEDAWCREFLAERGNIGLSDSAHFLLMVGEGKPSWVVAFDDWVGKTCHLYVAADGQAPVPRTLAWATFNYAFNRIGRLRVFAVCNSHNERVIRLVKWLGMVEVYRGYACHEDGGDIVFLDMTRERWLRKVRNGQEKHTSAA